MPNFLHRLATRSAVKIPKTGYGNVILQPASKSGGPRAGTTSVSYITPGQPQYTSSGSETNAVQAYLASAYVMRCVRTIADTIAGLPFLAGDDPLQPQNHNPEAPLAKLLGPATIEAPGGPNPTTSSRAFWAWSIVQKKITGRYGWEIVRDPVSKEIFSLWPLVSTALQPIPSAPGSQRWFDGFRYTTGQGFTDLTTEQVFYSWYPSIKDWRQPESVMDSAGLAIEIQLEVDRYMRNLLKNGMAARKMVITPPFAEADEQRAFEEQFLAEFSGVDRAGSTIFAQGENDYDAQSKLIDQASVQVIDLATSPTDGRLLELVREAKNDICIAIGVPRSLIGDASQRIYANADAEYRNFWTLQLLNDIRDLQDSINVDLAPQIGSEVGWFDLSNVASLQPPQTAQQPTVTDLLNLGMSPDQIQDLLGVPDASALDFTDTSTVETGEESPTPNGKRSGYRSPVFNTFCMDRMATMPVRERIVVRAPKVEGVRAEVPELAVAVKALADSVRTKRQEGKRSADLLATKGFDEWLEEMTPDLLASIGAS